MQTVRQLIEALLKMPADHEVQVWLPGSRITLGSVWEDKQVPVVLIEGNILEGSVLDTSAPE